MSVAAGTAGLALDLESYWIGVFAPVIVMALGMAAVVTPLTTVVMNSAPDARSGAASGVNNAASRIAGLIAVAALGAVAAQIFHWFGAPSGTCASAICPRPAIRRARRSKQAFVAAYSGAMALAAPALRLAGAAAFFWLTDEDCRAACRS